MKGQYNVPDANAGTFYSAISNVDFEIGPGNAGAVAAPRDAGRPGAVDRARERWLTARCRGADVIAGSTRNLTQGTARGTRTR